MTRPPPLFPAGASRMSAYVNSGMIDPATMARDAASARADKFLDEFVGWREAPYVWCLRHPGGYARAAVAVPAWGRNQLAGCGGGGEGPSLAELESGRTGDAYWDDCQRCLALSGELHNNVRCARSERALAPAPFWAIADRSPPLAPLSEWRGARRYRLGGRLPLAKSSRQEREGGQQQRAPRRRPPGCSWRLSCSSTSTTASRSMGARRPRTAASSGASAGATSPAPEARPRQSRPRRARALLPRHPASVARRAHAAPDDGPQPAHQARRPRAPSDAAHSLSGGANFRRGRGAADGGGAADTGNG